MKYVNFGGRVVRANIHPRRSVYVNLLEGEVLMCIFLYITCLCNHSGAYINPVSTNSDSNSEDEDACSDYEHNFSYDEDNCMDDQDTKYITATHANQELYNTIRKVMASSSRVYLRHFTMCVNREYVLCLYHIADCNI